MSCGYRGSLQWHEVTNDERVVGKAIGEVLPVLLSEKPPESSGDCEWCRYVRMRVRLVISLEDGENINGSNPCYNRA
jgi:hypothetical protein